MVIGCDAGPRTLGDPPIGGLQPEEAGESGRDADRILPRRSRWQWAAARRPRRRRYLPKNRPGCWLGSTDCRVVPCSSVDVQLMPPNSLAVVWAASTAPVARKPSRRRVVVVGDPVLEDHGGIGERASPRPAPAPSPRTGTPPNGSDTSASLAASARARSKSVWLKALSGDATDGVDAGVERLERRELLGPKGVHQAAGVFHPRGGHRGRR